jgi:uncharacterized membrane protein YeaQ/YmgE (transglycosylase-associated protein family)
MEAQAIGWIAAIIIGGIAGWLAEQFMKSQMGLLMNIVLGIVGAAIASWLFGLALLWQIYSRRCALQIHFRQCGHRCCGGRAMSSRMA